MFDSYTFQFEYEPRCCEMLIEGTAELTDAGANSDHAFQVSVEAITLRAEGDVRYAAAEERALKEALKIYARARILKDKEAESEWADHLEKQGWRPPDPNREHRTDNHALAGIAR